MNNNIILIIILASMFRCASRQISRSISNVNEDVLASESFLRYSRDRLEKYEEKDKAKKVSLLCHSGDINDGISLSKEKYLTEKDTSQYWIQLGICHFRKFNLSKAEYFFQYAEQLKTTAKEKSLIKNNLGVIELHLRHYAKAEALFNQALNHHNNSLTPVFNLLQMDLQFGRIDEARKKIDRFEKISKRDPDIMAAKAVIYLQQGQFKIAENIFNSIPKNMRLREDIALNHATTLYMDKKYQQALDILNEKNLSRIPLIDRTGRLLKTNILLRLKEIEDKKRDIDLNRKVASKNSK